MQYQKFLPKCRDNILLVVSHLLLFTIPPQRVGQLCERAVAVRTAGPIRETAGPNYGFAAA